MKKINYKIRKHSLLKVPVIVALGKKEMEQGKVSIRRLGSESQEMLDLADFVNRLREEALPPF